jgi:hypothetical protein
MRVMDRDIALLEYVGRYRFLHSQQVCWLFPGDSRQNLKIRLRKLYHNGFLDRVQFPTLTLNDPFIYSLTERGAQLIAETKGIERGEVRWKRHLTDVEPSHIKHLLAINDLLISFRMALGKAREVGQIADYRVYRGDPRQHRIRIQKMDATGHRRELSVVPDVILLIQSLSGEYGVFFLEVDRGTMGLESWGKKVPVYLEYIASSALYQDWHSRWAILLTVTTTERRLLSLASKTAELGGRRGCWFTTEDQLEPDSALAAQWVRLPELFVRRNERVEKAGELASAQRCSILAPILEQ